MTFGRTTPIAGIAVALITCGVVAFIGISPWLAAVTAVIWIASLWIATPPPDPPREPRAEGVQLTRSGMRDLIEHSGVAMLVLEGSRIIIANAAAREALGGHTVGQDARVAFRHPLAIDLLSRGDGGSVTIDGLTGPRSSWRMTRQHIDEHHSLVELINRAAEADISRAHTDFVANASHELRTPLASIIGYVETLLDDSGAVDAKRAKQFHETVLSEARRLQALVDDLLSLSRVEAEKHDQPRDIVDLSQLVPHAARDGAGHERQDRLHVQVPSEAVNVRGDRNQLEQLVRNLIDNALKYGSPTEPVTVAVEPDGDAMALFSVRDRGEGIASEHIPHLTRRFYRTDPGRSRAAGGTGLGLAIVKHIVERHRGELDITSRRGEGTTVSVRLPLAD